MKSERVMRPRSGEVGCILFKRVERNRSKFESPDGVRREGKGLELVGISFCGRIREICSLF